MEVVEDGRQDQYGRRRLNPPGERKEKCRVSLTLTEGRGKTDVSVGVWSPDPEKCQRSR